MGIFKRKNQSGSDADKQNSFAEMALRTIQEGVILTNASGQILFVNPAAIRMTDFSSAEGAINLDYGLLLKIESKEGRPLEDTENPLIAAMKTGQPLDGHQCCLIAGDSGKRVPVSITVLQTEDKNRIITLRDITKELAEEGEQTEFISTASHEMRTPVASIEGYLSLALNPQTATIDARAKGYLDAAHAAAKHLGKLFHDLLDVTKLDDGHIRPHFVPVEMVGTVKQIADDYTMRMKEAKITYNFGADSQASNSGSRRIDQVVYGFVDVDFMREILGNIIDNAIKYTPAGGSVYIGVRGDGDRVLINVTDTGIGISSDDIAHIFQKFYRADNSDTREIGGTGLGLYLVKQRVEAMGGRVWAESGFGEGSTFYVSLPRLTSEEYEKRMIAVRNAEMIAGNQPQAAPTQSAAQIAQASTGAPQSATSAPMAPQPAPTAEPATQPVPAVPTAEPAPQPVPAPQPAPAQPVAPSTPTPAQAVPPVPTPTTTAPALQPAPVQPTAPPIPPAPPTSPTINPVNQINNNPNGGITK